MKFSKLLTSLALAAAAVGSHAAVIDFTGEAPGTKANGYTVGGVSFSDTVGANLEVQDWSQQSHGSALAVFSDDASKLKMTFGASTALSLEFGNDDACCSAAGNGAWLQAFLGNTLVGMAFVTANRNDLMDQSISIANVGTFDNALFFYGTAAGAPINLIEIVDNISLTPAAVVPEPDSYALMLAGLGAIGVAARRRKIR